MLRMAHKPFTSLLRGHPWTCNVATRFPQIPRRTFTSSPLLFIHGPVPTFKPASNPELQTLLDDLRLNYFLPRHLSSFQRKLVTNAMKKDYLEKEEVIASIHGEDFRLRHIPNKSFFIEHKKTCGKILELMDKEDWGMFPDILRAFSTVGAPLPLAGGKKNMRGVITRRAAQADRQDVILECLRRVSDTQFTLQPSVIPANVVFNVMLCMQSKAMNAKWDTQETRKALSWAEMVAEMVQDPKFKAFDAENNTEELAIRVRYSVISVLLELAAVRASKHLQGKDQDGKVAMYVHEFMALPWDINNRLLPTNHMRVVLLHGMRIAETLLDPQSEEIQGSRTRMAELEEWATQIKSELGVNGGEVRPGSIPPYLQLFKTLLDEQEI